MPLYLLPGNDMSPCSGHNGLNMEIPGMNKFGVLGQTPFGEGLDLTGRNIPLALMYYCAKFGRYVAMSPWVELSTENFANLGTPSQGS